MLPSIRTRLNNPGKTSEALRQLLNLTYPGVEIESITVVDNGIHNTKLILALPNGVERVVFYNRTDIATMLRSDMINGREINEIINALKLEGFDFTEDDLEIVNDKLSAKPTSLGYIGNLPIMLDINGVILTLEIWRDENMAYKVKLTWNNTLAAGVLQEVERKVGTSAWEVISITLVKDGAIGWKAYDDDISFSSPTTVKYRIVQYSGDLTIYGDEFEIAVPVIPALVDSLYAEIVDE